MTEKFALKNKNPKTLLSESYIMDKKDHPTFDMDVMKECERLLAEYREGNKSSIYSLNEFKVSIVPIVVKREKYNG